LPPGIKALAVSEAIRAYQCDVTALSWNRKDFRNYNLWSLWLQYFVLGESEAPTNNNKYCINRCRGNKHK